jgi:hypothetical protein
MKLEMISKIGKMTVDLSYFFKFIGGRPKRDNRGYKEKRSVIKIGIHTEIR